MQVMPIAVRAKVQMVKTSSLVSRLHSTGEAIWVDEISGIGRHGVLKVKCVAADSRQKRQDCQQRLQQSPAGLA